MASQRFSNHVRYYPPHHFVFYPFLLLLEAGAVYNIFCDPALRTVWIFIALLILLIGWLSYMLRQHYALMLQNRMVMLEMRHRYFVLTGKPFDPLEQLLSFSQVAALRFAPDEELLPLIEKTLQEALPPRSIKQQIRSWKADTMRV
ncbi:DUF6526 family protein [Niabella drilacis]|uniref:Uncharacterized protein n=1 Tax=Niabella drilacis (strain DSM 25811 / CCM 8410 / CCUG 62505 / LMG 26954 / E90) TaxID=1285928 RepID=A0A1G6TYZ9_NIADE|nr:DUF6526 family protein [Niabella drilacis]SDD34382.1 hypothetical protein SAMN04487894_10889 [Niabella drilacis]